MMCLRCQGLLVREWLRDLRDAKTGAYSLPGWRCVNCGDVIDRVIVRRRRASHVLSWDLLGALSLDARPSCRARLQSWPLTAA